MQPLSVENPACAPSMEEVLRGIVRLFMSSKLEYRRPDVVVGSNVSDRVKRLRDTRKASGRIQKVSA